MSALQTRLDAQLGKTPEQQDTAGAADTSPEAGDSRPNPFETERWKTLRDEFGDIVEPIEEVISADRAATAQEIAALKDENRQLREGMEMIGQDRLYSRAESQEAQVREAHPDLDEVLKSDEYAAWRESAPAYIRAGIERNAEAIIDAAEASDIVKRFKTDTGYGNTGGAGDGSASTTANGQDGNASEAANGADSTETAAPSRRREAQLRSATAPRIRSGEAAVRDKEPETPAEMWDWAKKKIAAEREAAI